MGKINWDRVRSLSDSSRTIKESGPILYWMSRDQRVKDNWALIAALELGKKYQREVRVIFALAPNFLGATLRAYDFLLRGLEEVEEKLAYKGVAFEVLLGDPSLVIPEYLKEEKAALLVTDFDPLRIKRAWKNHILDTTDVEVLEVDAHNIVPCWAASTKQEFGAYTLRPKIHKLLPEYLDIFPNLSKQETTLKPKVNWEYIRSQLSCDATVGPVDWILPGEDAAEKALREFIEDGILGYSVNRNDPNKNAQSQLSPYLHFGQISAQRIALEVMNAKHIPFPDREAFLEELIVRRELSDNFCFYNKNYDTFDGFPHWAKESLGQHEDDKREYVYSKESFEYGKTHDQLWNAAQKQMAQTGKMHGYMRMYWAKKILEWTKSPREAMEVAVYLNDKYELDGRDPNGYVGCAWSIGGVHDRAWFDRPVYGKIRYMNRSGCEKKFDVASYIGRFS